MQKRIVQYLAFAVLCPLFFSSCFFLAGIKDPKKISFEESKKFIIKNLDTSHCRIIKVNNAGFYREIVLLSKTNNGTSLFFQPFQFYVFNNGNLVSMGANCSYPTKTLFTLNWDHFRQFSRDSAYLPLRADTSVLYKNDFSSYLDSIAALSPGKNTMIVFASKFMKKTCRDYLKYIEKYKATHPQHRFIIVPFDHIVGNTLKVF